MTPSLKTERGSGNLVTGAGQHLAATLTQVFVQIDDHRSCPDLDVSFARHLRAVGNAGPDIGFLKTGVVLQDVGDRPSARQEIENQRDPDAVSLDARLAETDVRVGGTTPRLPLHDATTDGVRSCADPLPLATACYRPPNSPLTPGSFLYSVQILWAIAKTSTPAPRKV